MKHIKKISVRVAAFAAVIAVLWGLLTAAAFIPNEKIYDNMLTSALSYKDKDAYPYTLLRLTEDNYADSVLLNIAWNMGEENPAAGAVNTRYYDGNDGTNDYGENWGLYQTVLGTAPNTDYTRYWHGTAAVIRPLMLFTDVDGIKLIGTIAAAVLLIINCILLVKKRQYFAAAALAGSFICVHFWNIRLSMEYQPAIIITLAILPLFITLGYKNSSLLSLLCVVSGTMIAFFDFLTTETLTLLIPLETVFIMKWQDKQLPGLKKALLTDIECFACWLAAYAGAFLVKWTAASLVTGENKFSTALTSAEVRISGSAYDLSPVQQFFLAPIANISTLFGGTERISPANIAAGLLMTLVVCGAVFYLFRSRERVNREFLIVMGILAAVPFVRFFLLNNHSYIHEFFTYRALAATIMALAAMLWSVIDLFPKKKKTSPKRRKS